jgi:hypothetical protein
VDRPLAVLGLKRSVGLVLPYFQPACLAVAQSNMILTTPSRLAREREKIAVVRVIKAPAELAGFKYEMTWHARLTADPAHVRPRQASSFQPADLCALQTALGHRTLFHVSFSIFPSAALLKPALQRASAECDLHDRAFYLGVVLRL